MFAPCLGSQLRGNRVLYAQFVHFNYICTAFAPFWAPDYAVAACCVHSSYFLAIFAPFLGSQLRGNSVLCAQFVHFFFIFAPFLGSQLRGNRVLCAQFAHFSVICTIFGLPTTR